MVDVGQDHSEITQDPDAAASNQFPLVDKPHDHPLEDFTKSPKPDTPLSCGISKTGNDRDGSVKQEPDGSSRKRRKTRWSSTDAQLKLVGPLQLPDFTKHTVLLPDCDTEMQHLRDELVDIDYKLQGPAIHLETTDQEQPASPQPASPEPGIRINSREERVRQKLIERRQHLISRLIKKQPTFMTPKNKKIPKLTKKLYVPVKQFPGYNFAALIIGPGGNTQKRLEKETGATISLRGSGSFSRGKHTSENDDLHVLIEADNDNSLDAASNLVVNLLTPIDDRLNHHKCAQLKELAELKESSTEQSTDYVCGAQCHQHQAHPNRLFNSPSAFSDTSNNDTACLSDGIVKSSESPLHGRGTLLLSQLPESVDDHLLKELCCPFGSLIEAKVIRDEKTGKSKGCGFVKFADPNDAEIGASHLNGFRYEGTNLAVKVAPSSTPARVDNQTRLGTSPNSSSITRQTPCPCPPGSMLMGPWTPSPFAHAYSLEGGPCINNKADLIVCNLPDSVDENRLKELFCPFGRLRGAEVMRDGNTGRSKCCGSVEFENPEDASIALLHLNGFEFEGRPLTVSWFYLNQTQTAWPEGTALKLPPSVFSGHGGVIPRGPSFTLTPPSTGSSSFDINSLESFGPTYSFSDDSPFSSLGHTTVVNGDPNYQNSQCASYVAPDSRPSPPSQLVHTPGSMVRPIFWSVAPRPS